MGVTKGGGRQSAGGAAAAAPAAPVVPVTPAANKPLVGATTPKGRELPPKEGLIRDVAQALSGKTFSDSKLRDAIESIAATNPKYAAYWEKTKRNEKARGALWVSIRTSPYAKFRPDRRKY